MSATSQSSFLPDDLDQALLVGRVWRRDGAHEGPSGVAVRGGHAFDITGTVPTTADLFDRDDAAEIVRSAPGDALGPVEALVAASAAGAPDDGLPPGTRWADVPDDWRCPLCDVGKAEFAVVEF